MAALCSCKAITYKVGSQNTAVCILLPDKNYKVVYINNIYLNNIAI